MKERPILFKAEMVNAIREGRKNHSRRVIKQQPQACHSISMDACSPSGYSLIADAYDDEYLICPYGKRGDRLWVRENFQTFTFDDIFKPSELIDKTRIFYTADDHHYSEIGKVRPSIFMCRWMSRILLEITDVSVERLNNINEKDALAEGVMPGPDDGFPVFSAKTRFRELWISINGDDSWHKNPWVWRLEFRVVK